MSIPYPNIDPVAISIGPLPLRWYSLAYIGGLALGWFYAVRMIKNASLWRTPDGAPISKVQLDDLVFWVAIGTMLGGRLGYLFFYEPAMLVAPWQSIAAMTGVEGIIKTLIGWIPIPPALMLWRGGMSFHGGLIGVTLVGWLFSRKHKLNALSVGDLFASVAPIGLFFGRIANFINAELYGRAWDGPWAMVFPTDPLAATRHPSQLYEAALEGIVLFTVIRIATYRFEFLKKPGATIGLFLAGYALSRIVVENFRMPDTHMPDFPLGLTMGMLLSMPMLGLGVWLIWSRWKVAGAKAEAKP